MVASKRRDLATFIWSASSDIRAASISLMVYSDSFIDASFSSYPRRTASESGFMRSFSESIMCRARRRRIISPFSRSIFCESSLHCGTYTIESSCTTRCSKGISMRPRYPQSMPTVTTVPSMSVVVPIALPTRDPYMSFTYLPIILDSLSVIGMRFPAGY